MRKYVTAKQTDIDDLKRSINIKFGIIMIAIGLLCGICRADDYLFPLKKPIYVGKQILCTSWFSKMRTENGKTYQYKALNYPCEYGAEIVSPADGEVILTKIDGYEGAIITIRFDDGVECTIAHLSKYFVLDNTRVKKGQLIALAGKSGRVTGPHIRVRFDKHGERVFACAKTWGKEYNDFKYSQTEFDCKQTKYYM